jgi:hypothetical protein
MTDIWSWYHDKQHALRQRGEHAFVDGVSNLSSLALDGLTAQVEASFQALVTRARELDEPWIEVYLRHWRLQNLLFSDINLRKAMPEAAALIEFSSRPETKNCPQSICAVQDFCIAFGAVDGPGYADDRIEMALDTIARIEPSRQCYGCLVAELVDAYIDKGTPETALAFIERDGPHIAAGMAPEALGRQYRFVNERIARQQRDWPALLRAGEQIKTLGWQGNDADPLAGRAACALAHCGLGEISKGLDELEPWADFHLHRNYQFKAAQAVLELLQATWPVELDRTLWTRRLSDAIRQFATDGQSNGALTLAITAAPLIAREFGRAEAIALLDHVTPELKRLREPDRLGVPLTAARAALEGPSA